MVRPLKYHEEKLLKKVNFLSWKLDRAEIGIKILIKRFHIVKRDDMTKYKELLREIRKLHRKIVEVYKNGNFAKEMMSELTAKLYSMGLIGEGDAGPDFLRIHLQSFCQRRLPAMMVNKGMMTKVSEATKYVQQGHVRVGPDVIKDPAYLVTRHMEDFITWVDTSAIKRHIMEYNEMRDDYEMM